MTKVHYYRRVSYHDAPDFYPTPAYATKALFEQIRPKYLGKVWEPACGKGHMSEVIKGYAEEVVSSDLYNRGVWVSHGFPE